MRIYRKDTAANGSPAPTELASRLLLCLSYGETSALLLSYPFCLFTLFCYTCNDLKFYDMLCSVPTRHILEVLRCLIMRLLQCQVKVCVHNIQSHTAHLMPILSSRTRQTRCLSPIWKAKSSRPT